MTLTVFATGLLLFELLRDFRFLNILAYQLGKVLLFFLSLLQLLLNFF
jgi:hypothetical protein